MADLSWKMLSAIIVFILVSIFGISQVEWEGIKENVTIDGCKVCYKGSCVIDMKCETGITHTWTKLKNDNIDITDFIEAEWTRINDTYWRVKLRASSELKANLIGGVSSIQSQKRVAREILGNESKWAEIRDYRVIPLNIMNESRTFNLLEEREQLIILPEWKEGYVISYGFGTEYWSSSNECTINTSRSFENVTIVYTCDVSVKNNTQFNLTNVELQPNVTGCIGKICALQLSEGSENYWQNITLNVSGGTLINNYVLSIEGNLTLNTFRWKPALITDSDIYLLLTPTSKFYYVTDANNYGSSYGYIMYTQNTNSYKGNYTVKDSVLDGIRTIELLKDANVTFINTTFGNGDGTEDFSIQDYSGARFTNPYSNFSGDNTKILIWASNEEVRMWGYIDMPEMIDHIYTTGRFNRYYPLFVYDITDNVTGVENINVTVYNFTTGIAAWTGLTNVDGYAEPNIVFSYADCETATAYRNFSVYIDGSFQQNITCLTNTHNGLTYSIETGAPPAGGDCWSVGSGYLYIPDGCEYYKPDGGEQYVD